MLNKKIGEVMKKEIILHIGLHKTATTSIQSALYYVKNEEILARNNLSIIKNWYENNSWPVCTMFSLEPEKYLFNIEKKLSKSEIDDLIEKWKNEALESLKEHDRIIISGEDIALLNVEEIGLLKHFFAENADVEFRVIAYVRNPIDLASSLFQQGVKGGLLTLSSDINGFKTNMDTYYSDINNFIEVFTREKVEVYSFEDACKHEHGPVGHFFSNVGVREIDLYKIEFGSSNESLTSEGMKIASFVNEKEPIIVDYKLSKNRENADLYPLSRIKGSKFYLQEKTTKDILDFIFKSLEWLNDEFKIDYRENDLSKLRIKNPEFFNISSVVDAYCFSTDFVKSCILEYYESHNKEMVVALKEINNTNSNYKLNGKIEFENSMFNFNSLRVDYFNREIGDIKAVGNDKYEVKFNEKTDLAVGFRELSLCLADCEQFEQGLKYIRVAKILDKNDAYINSLYPYFVEKSEELKNILDRADKIIQEYNTNKKIEFKNSEIDINSIRFKYFKDKIGNIEEIGEHKYEVRFDGNTELAVGFRELALCFSDFEQYEEVTKYIRVAKRLNNNDDYNTTLCTEFNEKNKELANVLKQVNITIKEFDLNKKEYFYNSEIDLESVRFNYFKNEIGIVEVIKENEYEVTFNENIEKAVGFRELALCFADFEQYEEAIKYIRVAKNIKPNDEYINKLCIELTEKNRVLLSILKIADDILTEYELNKKECIENSEIDVTSLRFKYFNSEIGSIEVIGENKYEFKFNENIELAVGYRELALCFAEFQEYKQAVLYISVAKKIKPNDEYIKSLFNEFVQNNKEHVNLLRITDEIIDKYKLNNKENLINSKIDLNSVRFNYFKNEIGSIEVVRESEYEVKFKETTDLALGFRELALCLADFEQYEDAIKYIYVAKKLKESDEYIKSLCLEFVEKYKELLNITKTADDIINAYECNKKEFFSNSNINLDSVRFNYFKNEIGSIEVVGECQYEVKFNETTDLALGFRELALCLADFEQFEQAIKYIQVAKRLNNDDEYINNLNIEFKEKQSILLNYQQIADDIINAYELNQKEGFSNSNINLDSVRFNYFKNEIGSIEVVGESEYEARFKDNNDLSLGYRELALCLADFEQMEQAVKYIRVAKRLNNNDEYINSLCTEFTEKLKNKNSEG